MKKTFLLFEMLVALGLMGMLLTCLFSFLAESVKMEKKIEKARALSMERQSFHVQLQDIFSSLSPFSGRVPLYMEGSEGLFFYFDHGVDPDPSLSGLLEGKLCLEEGGKLTLSYGPIPLKEQEVFRKQTLFSGVLSWKIDFLSSADLSEMPHSVQLRHRWKKEWTREERLIPSLIRMVIVQEAGPLQFAFRLPEVEPIATWRVD